MAVGIVYFFKVVDIAEDEAERAVCAAGCSFQHDVKAILKGPVIDEPGQTVCCGHLADLFVRLRKVYLDRYLVCYQLEDLLN